MASSSVLIIDDDPDIRELFATFLRPAGYQVTAAADGVSGLSMAQRQRPDMILLDIGLPAGDGLTVLKRLKGLTTLQSVPVLVISGRSAIQCGEEVKKSEAIGFLQKPVDRATLLSAVRSGLKEEVQEQETGPCSLCGADPAAAIDPRLLEQIATTAGRAAAREVAQILRSKASVK